jgi:hypothetical protein
MKPAINISPKFVGWALKHGTPWEVRFPKTLTTPYQRRYFRSEEAAREAVRVWSSTRTEAPSVAVGKRRLDAFLQAESLLPSGVSLLDAVRHYIATKLSGSRTTIKEVLDGIRTDHADSKARAKYVGEIARAVAWLEKAIPLNTAFASVTRKMWLDFIREDTASYWNRYARKRLVSLMVSKAREMEAITSNPLDGFILRGSGEKRASVLSCADAEAILSFAKQRAVGLLPALALQLFCGIRTGELDRDEEGGGRLQWRHVLNGRGISVPGHVAKMRGERDFVHFWPASLERWLPEAPQDGNTPVYAGKSLIIDRQSLLRSLNSHRKKAGLPPVPYRQNCFRHTFASMACAFFQDAGAASLLCRQKDKDVFWRFYRERVEPSEAPRYFGQEAPWKDRSLPFAA